MIDQNKIKPALDAAEYLMKWAGKELTITGTAVMKDKIVLIYSTLTALAEQPVPTGDVAEAIVHLRKRHWVYADTGIPVNNPDTAIDLLSHTITEQATEIVRLTEKVLDWQRALFDSQDLVDHLKEQLTDLRDKYLAAAKHRQEAEDELAAERAEKLEWNSICMKLIADFLAAESNLYREHQAHEQTRKAFDQLAELVHEELPCEWCPLNDDCSNPKYCGALIKAWARGEE